MDPIVRWKSLEAKMKSRGLGWALHHLPPTLRVARTPDFATGLRVEHLYPADYRAFCEAVGYPVIGFEYYCRQAFSFLPPEHQQVLSPMIFDDEGDEIVQPTDEGAAHSPVVLFAAYDLSDIGGYAFVERDGEPLVFEVDNATLQGEPVGTFADWVDREVSRLSAYIDGLSDDDIAEMKKECNGETDPHRAIDYALYDGEEHVGFSKEDLALHWVEDQAGSPYYRYGLINDAGEWLISLGPQFQYVAPFRDGRAIVKTPEDRYVVNTKGQKVGDAPLPESVYGENRLDSKGKYFGLAGRADKMGIGNFTANVERIGGRVERELTPLLDFIVVGDCQYFPDAKTTAERLAADKPSLVLMTEQEFIEKTGFVFSKY